MAGVSIKQESSESGSGIEKRGGLEVGKYLHHIKLCIYAASLFVVCVKIDALGCFKNPLRQ